MLDIRSNDDGTYDLWDGDVHLLERATLLDIAHFEKHGHESCEDNCPNQPRDDYDDGYAEAYNRGLEEEALGRPLFPNEY